MAIHEFVAFLGLLGFGRIAADLPSGFHQGFVHNFSDVSTNANCTNRNVSGSSTRSAWPPLSGSFAGHGLGRGGREVPATVTHCESAARVRGPGFTMRPGPSNC